jgi:hypothetical protein
MALESSEARNTTQAAISDGSAVDAGISYEEMMSKISVQSPMIAFPDLVG